MDQFLAERDCEELATIFYSSAAAKHCKAQITASERPRVKDAYRLNRSMKMLSKPALQSVYRHQIAAFTNHRVLHLSGALYYGTGSSKGG